MLRGPYARASAADRARIVQCADDGGDWKQLCATLQVNPKTAYVWVKAGAEERRPTAGGRRKALTEEQVDALCLMVEEDPSITLNALKERLLNDFEVRVSVSSIHNYLEGRLFTVKKVHYQMVEANNPRNKALRLEYVQRISTHMLQNKTIIWMDETNINLYCRRTRGRAPAGQRAVVALPGSEGPNVHVIGAITNFLKLLNGASCGEHSGRKVPRSGLPTCCNILPQGSTSTHK